MKKIKMVVLTKSSKFKNNCVAGIDVNTGKWIRLVSDDENTHGALTDNDISYQSGGKCKILDIIIVQCIQDVPTIAQPENILIDTDVYIEREGSTAIENVIALHPAENHNRIFGNRYNYIKESYLEDVDYSLTLIDSKNLNFTLQENDSGNLKLKVDFDYNGIRYENFSVTDPEYYDTKQGTTIETAYMVISIGTPYKDNCYKFVAKIFEK